MTVHPTLPLQTPPPPLPHTLHLTHTLVTVQHQPQCKGILNLCAYRKLAVAQRLGRLRGAFAFLSLTWLSPPLSLPPFLPPSFPPPLSLSLPPSLPLSRPAPSLSLDPLSLFGCVTCSAEDEALARAIAASLNDQEIQDQPKPKPKKTSSNSVSSFIYIGYCETCIHTY